MILALFTGYLTISPKSEVENDDVYLNFPNIDVRNNFLFGIYAAVE
jgi:hypothetical protein